MWNAASVAVGRGSDPRSGLTEGCSTRTQNLAATSDSRVCGREPAVVASASPTVGLGGSAAQLVCALSETPNRRTIPHWRASWRSADGLAGPGPFWPGTASAACIMCYARMARAGRCARPVWREVHHRRWRQSADRASVSGARPAWRSFGLARSGADMLPLSGPRSLGCAQCFAMPHRARVLRLTAPGHGAQGASS